MSLRSPPFGLVGSPFGLFHHDETYFGCDFYREAESWEAVILSD